MNEKNKILLIIGITLLSIVLLIGGTVAFFGWRADREATIDVTIAAGRGECSLISDNNILLEPTNSKEKGRIIKLKAKQEVKSLATLAWNINVKDINGLQHETFKYELINTTTGTTYSSPTGNNFKDIVSGNTLSLTNESEILRFGQEYEYTLYLWIDGTMGNNPLEMADQIFNFDINCTITGIEISQVNLDNKGATTIGTPVLYMDDEVYLDSEKSKKMTSTENPITIPTKTGYTFAGYYKENDNTQVISPAGYLVGKIDPQNDVISAKWTTNTYTITYNYSGGTSSNVYTTSGQKTYTTPTTGSYKLEAWGAQGGNGDERPGGYGGYSVGTVSLTSGKSLYLYVGGTGTDGSTSATTTAGGYNGGGSGYCTASYYVGGGGGATHIATVSGLLSTLSSYSTACVNGDSSCPILIVAGGGGGSAYNSSTARTYNVGCGGGYIGKTATGKTADGTGTTANGGTQTGYGATGSVKGSFGAGASGNSSGRPGGGGGWYGGNSSAYAGGGGSGFIGNSLLTDKAMYCNGCTASTSASTLTTSTSNYSSTPTANYVKAGNGAIRITPLTSTVTYGTTYGTLPTPTKSGYIFAGWNTKSDGSGTMVTSSTKVTTTGNQTLYAIWTTYVDGKSGCFDVTDKTYKPNSNWRITLNVCWNEQYNTTSNTSKVSITDIKAKIASNYGFTYYLGGSDAESSTTRGIYINGTKLVPMSHYTGGYRVYFSANNKFSSITSKKEFPWTSGEIAHNSDGTKTIPIRVYLEAVRQTESSSYYSTFDTTTNITLTDTKP